MHRDVRALLFAALLAAVLWCSWLVLKPFVNGMIWAAVLVVTFKPLHARLAVRFRGRSWAASAVVTLVVAAFIVVPIVVAAAQVVQGATQAYEWVQTSYDQQGPVVEAGERWPWIEDAVARAKELMGVADVDVRAVAVNFVKKLGAVAAAKAPAFLGNMLGVVFSFVIMLVMMFVFFSSGGEIVAAIARYLPLERADSDRILLDTALMTRSVFISVGLTALVQAVLGTFGLIALGVPNAVTLGAAMFFAALLPGGTGVVWIPVAIWLAATGHPWKGIILAAWGAGVISTIDNVLRPYFARGGVKLPTSLLFLGMLGGLLAFGVVGLFAGPIILYLMRELLDVLRREGHASA
ncbi:MAG TPA: AI-2E family transporter [Candidatus Polarisedimenticolaceae bacterium]|nr:AI-2E family transporter [Candidatus Polarisedimenticolaceae bacterium]